MRLFARRALAVAAFLGLGGGAIGLIATLARASVVEPAALASRLQKSASSMTSLAGTFTQKSRIKLFKQELTAQGRFYFERPNRIRWEYLSPDPSTLIVDGDTATMAMPGAPVQRFDLARDATMRAIFEQLLLWLGGGSLERLSEGYVVTTAGSDAAPSLVLTPKTDGAAQTGGQAKTNGPAKTGGAIAKTFARIELRFDRNLLLHAIDLHETSGDEKEIVFGRMERNAKLPPRTFIP